ncbi:Flagellar motor switch protein FliM [Shigella sonnei]|nr:flagellar motor switch protein FliM [Shigella sonnei]CSR68978.1 Flagellar motor switch protein FliM [Shigella sonnei]CSR76266.1 Flagellar motor switch protein FliM [Shigella sonnei]CSR80728.1 Flagellar motor switch protein FliM [Shigella sonnei]CSS41817.1 Flagellar motor switch protein FliM [Shigella sonnei]CSS49632.1 Flagellar motor switch protein FliM [Shigella sonnei]
MGDSILSQAEIDALLNGDSEVKDEPTASVSGESDIRPYDPNTQRRVVRERLQALEIINERFARHFRMGLFNLLRRSPDITVGAIRIQPYHEFARNLPVPTNLNLIHLKPLRGTGLVVFSPSLVFIAVDNLFGGNGRFPTKVEGREFTHTEQRVINRMLKLALEGYSDAWKAINPLEVEYVRSEMQVKFTNITTSPNDIVDMNNPADDNNGAMDDLWAEALSEQKSTSSKSAADAVFQQFGGGDVSGTLQDIDLIMDIPVKLTVELGRTRMTIKELLRLTQGSVVALDGLAGEPLDILINGYLISQGEVVVVADKYGVRITDIITPSERMRRLSR